MLPLPLGPLPPQEQWCLQKRKNLSSSRCPGLGALGAEGRDAGRKERKKEVKRGRGGGGK